MDTPASQDAAGRPARPAARRRRISIADIAKASRVSSAVVSYVINDGPRPVHPETRARVLKAMRDLNYRPSAVVSGSSANRMDTVGVAFPRPDPSLVVRPFYSAIQMAIVAEALRCGQNTLVYSGCFDTDVHKNLRIYADGRCDGLILVTPPIHSELAPALKERGIPFVQILDSGGDPDTPTIDVDDEQGAYDMTRRLIDLGHTRIVYFAGDPSLAPSHLRASGYRRAMRDAGLGEDRQLVQQGEYSRESGYALARRVMQLPASERPSALFCANDDSAIGAMAALKDMGLRVPLDVSVAGADDIPEAGYSDPPLTTVHQPLKEWGARAVSMLLDIVRGVPSERRVTLHQSVVERGSTAPAAAPGRGYAIRRNVRI